MSAIVRAGPPRRGRAAGRAGRRRRLAGAGSIGKAPARHPVGIRCYPLIHILFIRNDGMSESTRARLTENFAKRMVPSTSLCCLASVKCKTQRTRMTSGISRALPMKPMTGLRHLCVLLCVLFLGSGCSADGDKAQWDAFWRDLRGENMQMRGSLSAADSADNHATQTKDPD